MKKYFLYTVLICFSPASFLNAQDVNHPSVDSVAASIKEEEDGVTNKKQRFSVIKFQDKMPVNSRRINDADLNKLRQDKAFWYADYKPKREAKNEAGKSFLSSFLSSQWLKIFLFIIFGVAILWLIISGDYKIFRRKSKPIKQESTDAADQNIFDIDFENELSQAITSGNFPLAIRLHYLHLLKELSLRNIIQYSTDYTNQHFVQQLRNSNYYNDFFSLTRSFEYIWYGKFPVSEPAFEKIQNNFIAFKNQIES